MQLHTKIRVALAGVTIAGAAAAAALLGPAVSAVGQSSIPLQLQIQVNSPASGEANRSITGSALSELQSSQRAKSPAASVTGTR